MFAVVKLHVNCQLSFDFQLHVLLYWLNVLLLELFHKGNDPLHRIRLVFDDILKFFHNWTHLLEFVCDQVEDIGGNILI